MQAADDVGYFLAELVDAWDECFYVVDARDEDLVFYCGGLVFGGAGEGFEAVDDVVAGGLVRWDFLWGRVRTYTSA